MTQTTLWLLPLVVGSVFGIIAALRSGISWSWGLLLQHSIVLLSAVAGLTVLKEYDWICAGFGWAILLSFTVAARIIVMKMTQAMGLLRCEQAVSFARLLRFIMWGPPGKFWFDLACMMSLSVQGRMSEADDIYEKWDRFGLPRNVAENLAAYSMIAYLMNSDWKRTLEKYQELLTAHEQSSERKKEQRFPFQIAAYAVRAFLETGRFREAAQALKLADFPASSYGRESLETYFLSYFAVLGSEEDLDRILSLMSQNKNGLPVYARLFWKGRCVAESRDYSRAISILGDSLAKTPESDKIWRKRTVQRIEQIEEKMLFPEPEIRAQQEIERSEAVSLGRDVLKRCFFIAEIMNSKSPARAVSALTGFISVIFICCYSPYILNDRSYLQISDFFFRYGVLDGGALKGEWWRVVSYQFLHGGLSHLFMNLFGLVWFGRFAENLFGSSRFLIIFFGSGILSGVAQIIMDPEARAVGASGAVLGVFGAGLAAMLKLKDVLPGTIRNHELRWMLAIAVTQLLFDQIVNFLFPARAGEPEAIRIAAAAHFSGMVSGFCLGLILPLKQFRAFDFKGSVGKLDYPETKRL